MSSDDDVEAVQSAAQEARKESSLAKKQVAQGEADPASVGGQEHTRALQAEKDVRAQRMAKLRLHSEDRKRGQKATVDQIQPQAEQLPLRQGPSMPANTDDFRTHSVGSFTCSQRACASKSGVRTEETVATASFQGPCESTRVTHPQADESARRKHNRLADKNKVRLPGDQAGHLFAARLGPPIGVSPEAWAREQRNLSSQNPSMNMIEMQKMESALAGWLDRNPTQKLTVEARVVRTPDKRGGREAWREYSFRDASGNVPAELKPFNKSKLSYMNPRQGPKRLQ